MTTRWSLGGIKSALDDYPELLVVGEAYNGRDAVRKARQLKPEIVVVDLSPKTVETHKYKIMEKLGASNPVEPARIAIRRKLIQA